MRGEGVKREGRIDWVDVMKGLLIISMVIGHTGGPFGTAIYLFHMPAFFVLSGLTYHGSKYQLTCYVVRQVQRILLPTLFINILYIFFYVLIQELGYYEIFQSGDPVSLADRLRMLFRWFATPDFGGATWFLFVLFESTIICRIVNEIAIRIKIAHLTWVGMLALGGVGWCLVAVKQVLPYTLDLALLACFFFGMGMAISQYDLFTKIDRRVMLPLCLVSCLFFSSFYFYGRLPMNWPTREFANPVIQIISCFSAVYVCQQCSAALDGTKTSRYLRWLGQHTYCILVTHFVFFRLLFGIRILVGKLPLSYLKNLVPTGELTAHGGWIILATLVVALSSALAWAAAKNPLTNYVVNAKLPERLQNMRKNGES